ncbi:hypothetical protein T484DRAFT_1847544 [Baffinella frigidus]|nr:hypothetical protein T484DRAFT_1847544 [Cryptophyta sp. CCMP2293]
MSKTAKDAEEGKKLLQQDKNAFHEAAVVGDATKVRQLIACGADMTVTNKVRQLI